VFDNCKRAGWLVGYRSRKNSLEKSKIDERPLPSSADYAITYYARCVDGRNDWKSFLRKCVKER